MSRRIIATVLIAVAWLSFVILYLAFWSNGLSFFQSVAIVLVSILILGGLMTAVWVSWGMKMAEKAVKEKKKGNKK